MDPADGAGMAFLWACVILGNKIPLVVELISKTALGEAVPMPTLPASRARIVSLGLALAPPVVVNPR
jgi:hypothetical protein